MVDRRFLSLEDLAHQKPPAWLIEGIVELNSLMMIAGPAASFKSFAAIDMMLSMASNRSWCGKRTMPSKVLYALGEGKASLLKRAQAWMHHHRISKEERDLLDQNFRTTFQVPQLAVKLDVDDLLEQLDEEDYKPDVIVIDTLARSFVGMDENNQKDVGLWIEQADRLRQIGYTVIFLHHTAKNTELGVKYRGSTAIIGAMDTALTMVRDGVAGEKVTLTVTKQKDHAEGKPLYLRRISVIPPGAKADDDGSIILVPAGQLDAGFDENQAIEATVRDLIDTPYESDAARARELARQFGITESAAKMRILRVRQG